MKKKKVLIVLLLSTFWIHAGAQFSKQLTSEEQNMYRGRSEEYTSQIEAFKLFFLSPLKIDNKYKEEINSIINYYETKRLLWGYKDKKETEEEAVFFKEYHRELYSVLFLNGSYPSTANYQLAFSLREKLNLSEKALRKLSIKVIEMNTAICPENEQDSWIIEFKELSNILTNEQMDYFLRKKCARQIWSKVDTAWDLLCKHQIFSASKDSINARIELYNYYSKQTIADILYFNNSVLRKEAYEAIKKFSPAIMHKVYLLQNRQKRRRQAITHKEKTISTTETTPRDNYIWATQSNQTKEKNIQTKKSIMLALGASGRIDRVTAFSQLTKYANEQNTTAMNALGLMYLKGYGTKADTITALNWWEKAGKSGCYDAYNNIGIFHKTEDKYICQEKAFSYFSKAASKGNPIGSYFTGYMLYKGLGCEQNYEKAIEHFRYSANINYAPSLYMLGLCYRNGYGLEKNETIGIRFLKQAAVQSYKLALKELEQPHPENSIPIIRKYNKERISTGSQHSSKRLLNKDLEEIESGEYIGFIITYDWSGKYTIEETPLILRIHSNGEQISGEWEEKGKESTYFSAHVENSKLFFDNKIQSKNTRYRNMKYISHLNNTDIQIIKEKDEISLLGSIRMYSFQTKEIERPMYLYVTKKNKRIDDIQITTYPNPFSKEFNLSLNIEKESNVCIYIYNIQGIPMYQYDAGKFAIGKQHIAIQPNLKKGTYIVKVFIEEKETQLIIMSN